MDIITVYGTATCTKCLLVKKYLVSKGAKFRVENAQESKNLEKLDALNIKTLPVLIYKDKVLSDFNPKQIDTLLEKITAEGEEV